MFRKLVRICFLGVKWQGCNEDRGDSLLYIHPILINGQTNPNKDTVCTCPPPPKKKKKKRLKSFS